jgi:hypothetical protein
MWRPRRLLIDVDHVRCSGCSDAVAAARVRVAEGDDESVLERQDVLDHDADAYSLLSPCTDGPGRPSPFQLTSKKSFNVASSWKCCEPVASRARPSPSGLPNLRMC